VTFPFGSRTAFTKELIDTVGKGFCILSVDVDDQRRMLRAAVLNPSETFLNPSSNLCASNSRGSRRKSRLFQFHILELRDVASGRELVDIAREARAITVVDVTQSVGQTPVNVGGWDADFTAGTGHK